MYKNIISFFSFSFITQNVRIGRERERESRRWLSRAHTRVTVRFCEISLAFCFVLLGSKSSGLYDIPDAHASPRCHASYLHVARRLASIKHATKAICVAFSLGNNVRPVYFRKQMHFLLCHSCNLCGLSKESYSQYLI